MTAEDPYDGLRPKGLSTNEGLIERDWRATNRMVGTVNGTFPKPEIYNPSAADHRSPVWSAPVTVYSRCFPMCLYVMQERAVGRLPGMQAKRLYNLSFRTCTACNGMQCKLITIRLLPS